jgi:hypothetical protein
VNQHETPSYVAKWFGNAYTHPNDWVIVCGAGAGGDVRGFLQAGCNVVAIEKDPEQYKFLCDSLAIYEATLDRQEAAKAAELEAAVVPPILAAADLAIEGAPACPNCPDHPGQKISKCSLCHAVVCENCLLEYDGRNPEDEREFCTALCFTASSGSATDMAGSNLDLAL